MYSDWIRQVEGKTDDRVCETEEPRPRVRARYDIVSARELLGAYLSLEELASLRPSGPRIGDHPDGRAMGLHSEPAPWTPEWTSSEPSRRYSPSEPEEAVSIATTDTVTISGTNYRVQYGRDEDGYNLTEYIPVSGEDSNTQSG